MFQQHIERAAPCRGMVDVIAKLQEAARKAEEAAERLERGEGAHEEEDEEAEAEAEAGKDGVVDDEAEADAEADQMDDTVLDVGANGACDGQPSGAHLTIPEL